MKTVQFVKSNGCATCGPWLNRIKEMAKTYKFNLEEVDVSEPSNSKWAMTLGIRSVPGVVVDDVFFMCSNPMDMVRMVKAVGE